MTCVNALDYQAVRYKSHSHKLRPPPPPYFINVHTYPHILNVR